MSVDSAASRAQVVEQLRADLIGPGIRQPDEVLPQAPSRWYLTGFLVPINAPEDQRTGDADAEGDLDSGDDAGGTDDQVTPDKASARKAWRPSSLGLSFLLEPTVQAVEVEVTWGDYALIDRSEQKPQEGRDGNPPDVSPSRSGEQWQRTHRKEGVRVGLSAEGRATAKVPNSNGLVLETLVRTAHPKTDAG